MATNPPPFTTRRTAEMQDIARRTSGGSLDDAIGRTFYGISQLNQHAPISINKDSYGLTFFTRPNLNLDDPNLRADRLFYKLLNKNPRSLQRVVRMLLDPTLSKPQRNGLREALSCDFVDNEQAFIPILTNNLLSISGWPEVVLPTYTSPEGVYKEQTVIGDGLTKNYSKFSLSANFRNLPGDPITVLFFYWISYISMVYQGIMSPYLDNLISNRIDYNTRIYRLVLDETKTFVQKIAACGAAIPVNAPLGPNTFNYEASRPINDGHDQISINFECVGAMYIDDILIREFNRTGQLFNRDLADNQRPSKMTKVPLAALPIFRNMGHPLINEDTQELEWWVSNETFNLVYPEYSRFINDQNMRGYLPEIGRNPEQFRSFDHTTGRR